MKHTESKIQIACVQWFSYQYPELYHHFFSVPNGGLRRLTTAQILKAEGAKPGVADLLLTIPNQDYHGLFIEMKTEKGTLSDNQKKFKSAIERVGLHKYVICRSFEEFKKVVMEYLSATQWGKKVS